MPGPMKKYDDISAMDLRRLIEACTEGEFQLVDVRQPEEYAAKHIPGAKLVPLMTITRGEARVTPARHNIFYCHAGIRSAVAARTMAPQLAGAKTYSLRGGITAWNGVTLPDVPSIEVFERAETLPQLLDRALDLEKGAGRLYGAMARHFEGTAVGILVTNLEKAEEGHAFTIYRMLERAAAAPLAPFDQYYREKEGLFLESGEPVDRLVEWMKENSDDTISILEVALDLELKAYDLYRSVAQNAEEPEHRAALLDLAQQEQRHVQMVLRNIGVLAAT